MNWCRGFRKAISWENPQLIAATQVTATGRRWRAGGDINHPKISKVYYYTVQICRVYLHMLHIFVKRYANLFFKYMIIHANFVQHRHAKKIKRRVWPGFGGVALLKSSWCSCFRRWNIHTKKDGRKYMKDTQLYGLVMVGILTPVLGGVTPTVAGRSSPRCDTFGKYRRRSNDFQATVLSWEQGPFENGRLLNSYGWSQFSPCESVVI